MFIKAPGTTNPHPFRYNSVKPRPTTVVPESQKTLVNGHPDLLETPENSEYS